jgi:signal transduction histidine kinase
VKGISFGFRHRIAFRVTSVFLALFAVTTAVAVFVVREFVRRDLRMGTRQDLVKAMGRMEADLNQMRGEVSLFARILANSAMIPQETPQLGEAAVQISLVEQARARGIEIARYRWDEPGVRSKVYLERGFAGIPTVDYVLDAGSPDKLHLVAVVPMGGSGNDRRVATASTSLGRDYMRRNRPVLEGDIALMAKGHLVSSASACAECLDCLRKILHDGRNWDLIEGGKAISFAFDCNPDSYAGIAVPLRAFDGQTVAAVLFRSTAGEKRALSLTTLGIAGGGAGFAAVMAAVFFLLAKRAVRPLTELTRLSAEISEGRYGETIPVHGEGEVAMLATSFNRMNVSLKNAMDEISDWNRRLESRVREKTQELEEIHRRMIDVEKLAAMGQLAAGVAHELNNPLSGIMGYSEIALEQFKDRPPEKVTPPEVARMIGYFGHIESLSQRCRNIILDMLKFARQHTEEIKEIRLNEVIRQTLVFLEKQISRGRIELVTDLPEGLPAILGNPLQLQQVFTNLVINAVQAMPSGGTLAVRTRRRGGSLEVDFSDGGPGIEPEHLHRIFEPFFTTKPVGEGTGLGLSVSYGIVKHHGGDIRVSSEPGKGATFTVALPLSAPA